MFPVLKPWRDIVHEKQLLIGEVINNELEFSILELKYIKDDSELTNGHILLDDYGISVSFINIKVMELN